MSTCTNIILLGFKYVTSGYSRHCVVQLLAQSGIVLINIILKLSYPPDICLGLFLLEHSVIMLMLSLVDRLA